MPLCVHTHMVRSAVTRFRSSAYARVLAEIVESWRRCRDWLTAKLQLATSKRSGKKRLFYLSPNPKKTRVRPSVRTAAYFVPTCSRDTFSQWKLLKIINSWRAIRKKMEKLFIARIIRFAGEKNCREDYMDTRMCVCTLSRLLLLPNWLRVGRSIARCN